MLQEDVRNELSFVRLKPMLDNFVHLGFPAGICLLHAQKNAGLRMSLVRPS